jgi:Tol biopolymer transport system component
VVFVRDARDSLGLGAGLWLAAEDGTGARPLLVVRGEELTSPRWSPDGRELAAVAQSPGSSTSAPRLIVIDVATESVRSIAPRSRRGLIGQVAWEPSGEALFYTQIAVVSTADFSGVSRLVRQRLRGGEAVTVAAFPRPIGVGGLVVLGAGRIVLDTDASRENLREQTLGAGAAATDRFLTHGDATDRQPCYSPDGEWILFSSARIGNFDLWKISASTSALHRVTDHPDDDWDPAWTLDGTRLLWSSNRTGHFEVWIANSDGSSPRQLTQDGVDAQNPTATPDAEWIVYASANPAHGGLWKIRSDGSQATRLVAGEVTHPEVSPDGRHALYFTRSSDGVRALRVHSLLDNQPEKFEITGVSDARARWLPHGRAIAFVEYGDQWRRGVFVQDFAPGRDTSSSRRRLAGFDPELDTESFGIAPDGARIVLAQIAWGAALLMVEDVPGLTGGANVPAQR